MTITLQAVNEFIASLESAGELSNQRDKGYGAWRKRLSSWRRRMWR